MGILTEMVWLAAIQRLTPTGDDVISCYVTPHIDGITGNEEQRGRLKAAVP